MATITLTASRGYQDIGTVGQTIAQLAGNVQSINQILDVGLRNTRDYQNSFVRVSDLIGLGLATLINGNQLTSSGAGGGGTTLTASDSVVITTSNITLVNDSATPGNDYFYGTNGSGARGWYALASYSGTVTSVGLSAGSSDIVVTGATPITSSGAWSIDLSTTVKADLALAATSIQPGGIQNMESALWNSTSGAVQTALTVAQDILIPFACTLQEVDVLTQGPVGSCTVTIKRGAATAGVISFPPTTDITGSANVVCAAASKQIGAAYATTLAGWTTAFGQNDILRLTLTANTNFTSVKVILRMY
ncbi:MAG: hypothetical protein ACHP8B_14150 [Terriglobales bacterium]